MERDMSGSERPSFSGALAVGRKLDLPLPDSPAVRDAYAHAEAESQPWLFNHVMRSWLYNDAWITANGAQMVARAWTDPEYRARMLVDGTAAARELGFEFPEHHRNLVVLENTATVHNVIVCTLCSCTAYTIIGAAPDWYKDLDYRARVVRESRTVLREMGLDLPATTEIRVWDTTADTRYMVLPMQPAATIGWPVQKLATIVTQDSMIGVTRLEQVKG